MGGTRGAGFRRRQPGALPSRRPPYEQQLVASPGNPLKALEKVRDALDLGNLTGKEYSECSVREASIGVKQFEIDAEWSRAELLFCDTGLSEAAAMQVGEDEYPISEVQALINSRLQSGW